MQIAFIQTGGTIDKDYPKVSKGWAFEIDEPAYNRILEKLRPSFLFKSYEAFKKDSQEITLEDPLAGGIEGRGRKAIRQGPSG